MTTTEISNSQDMIDSRDIIERVDYLEGLEDEADEDEKHELELLKALEEDAGTSEWGDGVTLINEDHFEDYAREFAEDIGAISRDTEWPATCIDWEKASNALQMDYSEVDFDGVTYYFR